MPVYLLCRSALFIYLSLLICQNRASSISLQNCLLCSSKNRSKQHGEVESEESEDKRPYLDFDSNVTDNAEDMENMVLGYFNHVSILVDTVDNAGIEEIIEILSKLVEYWDKSIETVKIQSRKSVMARMLTKSLQAGDAVFVRVSRVVYLATRGVVLGDIEGHDRLLTEMALRQVGVSVLTDRVAEAVKVLVVAAIMSSIVHGPWYAQIIENM